jgi:molybdate transport system substrate-binding protein
MKRLTQILMFTLLLVEWSITAAEPAKLTIAAAADLQFAMRELVDAFRKENPAVMVDVVAGSSGKFYEQIVHGAPFDLFFSADIKYPEELRKQGVAASAVRIYARGRIVLWSTGMDTGKMTVWDLGNPEITKIAIANPKHAPYGIRAEEALKKAGVWPKVEKKLVFGENVAQTAQFVETGAADVGIIALSLAASPALREKGSYSLIPEDLHSPLDQGYVILKRAEANPVARTFADFVISEPARTIFRRYGFVLPAEPPSPMGSKR